MDEDDRATAIEADHLCWRAWQSDTHRWWAARRQPLTADELNAGCVPFLLADDPDELCRKIEAEGELGGTEIRPWGSGQRR
jgi:hypothetical protein